MAKIFFSYSHKDEALRDELQTHFATLQRNGLIEIWHDRRIAAGDEFTGVIDHHLEEADIILLLFSPDFLASPYCHDTEAMRALQRHKEGTARVIPIILRPCDWLETPFSKLMAAPTDGKPVTKWPDKDEAFLDITQKIREALSVITSKRSRQVAVMTPSATTAEIPSIQTSHRSSNLQIKKTFGDREKDQFLHDAYGYISRFFEGSLKELQDRNPEVEGVFRAIDNQSFEATIYQNGKRRSHCGIWLGNSIGKGILYSSSGISPGSFNEQIAIEVDDQSLFLQPLMSMSGNRNAKLTFEGAAEALWAMLIRPLQY